MISGQSITKTEKREGNVEEKYIKIQYELQKQIEFHNSIDIRLIKNVAGVDLAYWNKNGNEYAVCCIIVLNYETQEVVEKKYAVEKVTVPYIPGCLAFRELPVFLTVYKTLDTAMEITNTLVTKDSHIPLPTRLADIMTHEIRKKYI